MLSSEVAKVCLYRYALNSRDPCTGRCESKLPVVIVYDLIIMNLWPLLSHLGLNGRRELKLAQPDSNSSSKSSCSSRRSSETQRRISRAGGGGDPSFREKRREEKRRRGELSALVLVYTKV